MIPNGARHATEGAMNDRSRLMTALKQLLKARGWRYADLAEALGVSEPTVKRMLSSGRMDLARLEDVCARLDIDFFELARIARGTRDARTHLSPAQEAALADAPRLMTMFHLLCQGWRVDAVREAFALDRVESTRLLAALDRLDLIELLPGDHVRLRVPRDFAWRDDGPVRARYMHMASEEFLRDRFDGPGALFTLELRELGDASVAQLRRRLERVVAEFREAADLDVTLPAERRNSVGLLLAMRPWVFSIVDSLRADAAAKPAQLPAAPRARRR